MKQDWQGCEQGCAEDGQENRGFPLSGQAGFAIDRQGAESLEHGTRDELAISVMIFTAEPGGDLSQGGGVLSRVVAIDESAFQWIPNSGDKNTTYGRRQLGHARRGDRIAIADQDESGGAGRPCGGDAGGFRDAVEELGLAGGKA